MKKQILEKIENSPFFSKETLRSISSESEETLSTSIKRLQKSGDLIGLKNGVYTTRTFFDSNFAQNGYTELVANHLCSPSYVSSAYVLGMNGILTESICSVTSVTLKTSRKYQSKLGSFVYHKISAKLFGGYEEKLFNNHGYYIATKGKALFDYLYLSLPLYPDDFVNVNMVEEIRLNLDDFTNKDFTDLEEFIDKVKNVKLEKLISNIRKYASN